MNHFLFFKNHLFLIKKRTRGFSFIIIPFLLFLLFSVQISHAQAGRNPGPNDLVLSLPDIKPLAYIENSQNKGTFVNLAEAMDRYYQNAGVIINGKVQKGRIILAGIYPFPRSIYNITQGKADFHIPLVINPLVKIEDVEKAERYNFSSSILSFGVFALYANKAFAKEIRAFEAQIGKKISEMSTSADYVKFNEFIQQKNRSIGVEPAHKNYYKFKTTSIDKNVTGLTMVVYNRLDAYIHNMEECDMVLANNKIDTSNMEKFLYHKFEVRMLIPVGTKNKLVNQIISQIIWGLQGRKASDVPLKNLSYAGAGMEDPNDPFLYGAEIKKTEYYKIMGTIVDAKYSSKLP